MNYTEDLKVDKFKLDEEWLNQPNLYMKYVKAAAIAKKQWDNAEEKVKVTRSILVRQCKFLNKKATGPEIEAYYRTHKSHKNAKDKAIQAQFKYNLMNGAIFAFQQRKSELEELVKLWQNEYWAEPRTEINNDFDKKVKRNKSKSKINKRLNRK